MNEKVPVQPRQGNPLEKAFAGMNKQQRREFVREFYKECNKYPGHMQRQEVPPDVAGRIISVWRSRDYLCTVWPSTHPSIAARMTINRAKIDEETGEWMEGISWDDLWLIKNQCGYPDHDAVEVYPAKDKLINVANMRHLWVMKERISFGLERD